MVVGVIVRLHPLAGGEDDDDGDQTGDAHDVEDHPQHRLDNIFADHWGNDSHDIKQLSMIAVSLIVYFM